MKILVLNCGSSSVKFQLIETDLERIQNQDEIVLARGMVEKIGLSPAIMRYQLLNENPLHLSEMKDKLPPEEKEPLEINDHGEAIQKALKVLTDPKKGVVRAPEDIDAVGHRVVHGGEKFQSSVYIDDDVLAGIRDCVEFAPLHNPHNLRGYYAAVDVLPHCPHVAIFDTAFHQTMKPHVFLYDCPTRFIRIMASADMDFMVFLIAMSPIAYPSCWVSHAMNCALLPVIWVTGAVWLRSTMVALLTLQWDSLHWKVS